MSEHRTTIRLGESGGFCDWGKKDRATMIKSFRNIAERQKAEAEAILSAADDDFEVYQHRGIYRERDIVVLAASTTAERDPLASHSHDEAIAETIANKEPK